MAANNFFTFTNGAAAPAQLQQFSALSAPTAYVPAAQTAYVQQPVAQTAYITAGPTIRTGSTGYETAYQTTPTSIQYAYTRTAQVAPVIQAAPAPTYDPLKAYYTPMAAVTPAAPVYTLPGDPAGYSTQKTYQTYYDPTKKYYPLAQVAAPQSAAVPPGVYAMSAEPIYQALSIGGVSSSKPLYVTNTYATQTQARQIATVKLPPAAALAPSPHLTLPTAYGTYQATGGAVYQGGGGGVQGSSVPTAVVPVAHVVTRSTGGSSVLSGLEAALYSAAASYYQHRANSHTIPVGAESNLGGAGSNLVGAGLSVVNHSTGTGSISSSLSSTYTTMADRWTAPISLYSNRRAGSSSGYEVHHRRSSGSRYGGGGSDLNRSSGGGGGGESRGSKPLASAVVPISTYHCTVCNIKCAGPQTYREHVEGQKHKKRAAATTSTGSASITSTSTTPATGHHPSASSCTVRSSVRSTQSIVHAPGVSSSTQSRIGTSMGKTTASSSGGVEGSTSGGTQFQCKLCDITCSSVDTYAAHVRGSRHQKVLKQHVGLDRAPHGSEVTQRTNVSPDQKQEERTKTGGKDQQARQSGDNKSTEEESNEDHDCPAGDVQPVGNEYIEESHNLTGTAVSFYCKLCDCKFTDPNAKIMHMKGRRHRLQFKKKVDPNLVIDTKPMYGRRGQQHEELRQVSLDSTRPCPADDRWRVECEMRYYEGEMDWQQRPGLPYHPHFLPHLPPHHHHHHFPPPHPMHMMNTPPFFGGPPPGVMLRRPHDQTSEDRHVMAKHTSIYPTEQELEAVQASVSMLEAALKLVSDHLAKSDTIREVVEEENMDKESGDSVTDGGVEVKEVEREEGAEGVGGGSCRALRGVVRTGPLAKGLLLRGDLSLNLVVLCTDRPTRTLLDSIADNLDKQIKTLTTDVYDVCLSVEEAGLIVVRSTAPSTTSIITLTSPTLRDLTTRSANNTMGEIPDQRGKVDPVVSTPRGKILDPPDVLDRQKCLDALAALRQAKWFQAKAGVNPVCQLICRLLRDMCTRRPTWTPIKDWPMELIVEKAVNSCSSNPLPSPGEALRRVIECIASGILLPGGPGVYDPCEKEPTDAASLLTNQQKEDITASAQEALREICFHQIHRVLAMESLSAPPSGAYGVGGKCGRGLQSATRKRSLSLGGGEGVQEEGACSSSSNPDLKREKKVV